MLTFKKHKDQECTKVLVTPKHRKLIIMKSESKVQTTNTKKFNQKAKSKNKPTKLSKGNNHQTNLVTFY